MFAVGGSLVLVEGNVDWHMHSVPANNVSVVLQVKHYLVSRKELRRVCLLVDAKWGLKPADVRILELLERCFFGASFG